MEFPIETSSSVNWTIVAPSHESRAQIRRNVSSMAILLLLSLSLIESHSVVDSSSIQHQNTTKQQQLMKIFNESIQSSTTSLTPSRINELIIENTSNETKQIDINVQNSNRTFNINHEEDHALERWSDFAFEEYDLMDYLQNLTARYKNVNLQQQAQSPGDELMVNTNGESYLVKKNNNNQEVEQPIIAQQEPEMSMSTNRSKEGTEKPVATTQSEMLTSLANEPLQFGSETGEKTWQYGIFDRFTRPRSTTTTPDPRYSIDANIKIDSSQYNSDECGLRTYEQIADRPLAGNEVMYPSYPIQASVGLPPWQEVLFENQGAAKEINQRRQKPSDFLNMNNNNGTISISDLIRWKQSEAIYNSMNKLKEQQQYLTSLQMLPSTILEVNKQQIANGLAKDDKENYDSRVIDKLGHEMSATSGNSTDTNINFAQIPKDIDELNLLAKRHWLKQKLSHVDIISSNLTRSVPTDVNKETRTVREDDNLRFAKDVKPLGTVEELQKFQARVNQLALVNSNIFVGVKDTINELRARQDELKLEARVIGGNDARLGDSPWSVSLQALISRSANGQSEYRHYCGGTIISEHYILTAAHCLDFMVGRESRLFVVMGDINWRMSGSSQYGRRYAIDKLIIHSAYKNTGFDNDIGLIKLKAPILPLKVNGRYIINSVCLPERAVEHGGEAELVGWGLFSNRNEMADSLQIAKVPILPRPVCVDMYRRRTGLIQWLIGIELITEKQVCAGSFGPGICQGDSGSALVVNEKRQNGSSRSSTTSPLSPRIRKRHTDDSRAKIIGVVAFGGVRRCSYQSLPGVYMQTSKYMDWILPRLQA